MQESCTTVSSLLEKFMQESCTTVSKIVGVIHARILQGSNASILQYYNVRFLHCILCKNLTIRFLEKS